MIEDRGKGKHKAVQKEMPRIALGHFMFKANGYG
jgi:hypothetical protein